MCCTVLAAATVFYAFTAPCMSRFIKLFTSRNIRDLTYGQ